MPGVDKEELARWGVECVRLYGRKGGDGVGGEQGMGGKGGKEGEGGEGEKGEEKGEEGGKGEGGMRYDGRALAQALGAILGGRARGERSRRNTVEVV